MKSFTLAALALLFLALSSQAAMTRIEMEGAVRSFDAEHITIENKGRLVKVPRSWMETEPVVGETATFDITSPERQSQIITQRPAKTKRPKKKK